MEEKEEKKKDIKTHLSISVTILVAVVMILSCLVVYLSLDKFSLLGGSSKDKEQKTEEKTKENLTEVELTEKDAKELIGYAPQPVFGEWSDTAYLDKKVKPTDMNINQIMYIAMNKAPRLGYNSCTPELVEANHLCDFTIKVSDVENVVEMLYGKAITLPDKVDGSFLWHCTKVKDVYSCSNSGGGFCGNTVQDYFWGTGTLIKYQRAEKSNTNLYVYVKYAHVVSEYPDYHCQKDIKPEEVSIKLYKYGTGNELITQDVLNGSKYYEENATKGLLDKIYDEYKNQMTDYKLTYKINGIHYTLVSVEPMA